MNGQTTIIKIASVKRTTKASQYNSAETYSVTTITDAKTGLEATGMGAWTDNWKEGDEIEVTWSQNNYTDRNGVARQSWKLTNPNAKKAPGNAPQARGGASESFIIAAALVGAQYQGVTLTPNVAKEAAEKIRKVAASLEASAVPVVQAAAPAAPAAPVQPAYVPPAQPAYVPPAPVAPAPVAPVANTTPEMEDFEEDDKPF